MQTNQTEFETIVAALAKGLDQMAETVEEIADSVAEQEIRQRRMETRLVQTMLHFGIDPYAKMKGHPHNNDSQDQA